MKIYNLDGTTLEGGGQLVRLSTCLAALTGKNLNLYSIRGKRSGNRGLKGQHLSAVTWLATACDADALGLVLGSKEVMFLPGKTRHAGVWSKVTFRHEGKTVDVLATRIDLVTPGAVTLNLQAILPFLIFAGCEFEQDREIAERTKNLTLNSTSSTSSITQTQTQTQTPTQEATPILLTLTGGTNVSNSPSIDYISQVLLPNLTLLGLPDTKVITSTTDTTRRLKRGWSSRSGRNELGSVSLVIQPLRKGTTLPAFQIPARGPVKKVTYSMLASGDILPQLRTYAVSHLHVRFNVERNVNSHGTEDENQSENEIEIEEDSAEDSGETNRLHVLVVAHTASGLRLGADCLCEEKIGKTVKARTEVAQRLVRRAVDTLLGEVNSGRSVDRWMEDQLVVFRALALGRSRTLRPSGKATGEEGEGSVSLHTRTVRWVANELLGVVFDEAGDCEGVGYVAGEGLPKEKSI